MAERGGDASAPCALRPGPAAIAPGAGARQSFCCVNTHQPATAGARQGSSSSLRSSRRFPQHLYAPSAGGPVGWGIALQLGLALFILKFEIGGVRPGYVFFQKIARGVKQFLEFTNVGSQFVFGPLGQSGRAGKGIRDGQRRSSSPSRRCRRSSSSRRSSPSSTTSASCSSSSASSRSAMQFAMRTSGAETLSAAANVFMGQTEAPIIVKPYVPGMTQLRVAGDDGWRHGAPSPAA